ncbi:hypothetical protein F5Y07DRAFT_223676 [Xylaria sp. FL0933]|nr:hypothetical protein F5Y07DRAFT_223676 [Xylaria sp. FL0933]
MRRRWPVSKQAGMKRRIKFVSKVLWALCCDFNGNVSFSQVFALSIYPSWLKDRPGRFDALASGVLAWAYRRPSAFLFVSYFKPMLGQRLVIRLSSESFDRVYHSKSNFELKIKIFGSSALWQCAVLSLLLDFVVSLGHRCKEAHPERHSPFVGIPARLIPFRSCNGFEI